MTGYRINRKYSNDEPSRRIFPHDPDLSRAEHVMSRQRKSFADAPVTIRHVSCRTTGDLHVISGKGLDRLTKRRPVTSSRL